MTRWILISDLHLGHKNPRIYHHERMRIMIDQVVREAPDFVINAGDHINGAVTDGETERHNVQRLWAEYHRVTRPLTERCPVISVIGNHDQTGQAADSKVYCQQTGRAGKPTYYIATIGGVQVIALDVAKRRHHADFAVGTAQHKWLRQVLVRGRQARCTIAVGHFPLFLVPWLYDNWYSDSSLHYNEVNDCEGILLPMLLDAGVDLYLCGHLHIYERTRYQSLTQVMAGTPDEVPFKKLLSDPPNKHCRVVDERACYVRFTLTGNTIRGEAVALDGDVIDTWAQQLNRERD